jgi:hypothetical protein
VFKKIKENAELLLVFVLSLWPKSLVASNVKLLGLGSLSFFRVVLIMRVASDLH